MKCSGQFKNLDAPQPAGVFTDAGLRWKEFSEEAEPEHANVLLNLEAGQDLDSRLPGLLTPHIQVGIIY